MKRGILYAAIAYVLGILQFIMGVFVYHEPFPLSRLAGFGIVWLALIIYVAESLVTHRAQLMPVAPE